MHRKRRKGGSPLKKALSLGMTAVMLAGSALGLGGCSSQEPDKYPDKEALTVAIVNYFDSDKEVEYNQAVVNKINDYLDNLGCEFKVKFTGVNFKDQNFTESEQYEKLKESDIIYACPNSEVKDDKAYYIDVLNALIDDGFAMELNDSLQNGLKDAADVIESYDIDLGEEIYSLPLTVQIPVSTGIKIEKKLFEDSKFEPRALESFEDCAELLEKLYKADNENAFLFVDQSASTVGYLEVGYKTTKPAVMDYFRDYMFVSASTAIDMKTGEAVNVYEEEEVIDYIKTMFSYSEKGYTTGTAKEGRAMFGVAVYPEPYFEKGDDEDSGYYVLPIGDVIANYDKERPDTGVCISAETQHKDWAEMFLNLVYSDGDFKRVVMFGDKNTNITEYLKYIEDNPKNGFNPTYAVPFMEMDGDLSNVYNYTDLEGNEITMKEIYSKAKELAPESTFVIDDVDFQSLEKEIKAVNDEMVEILRDMPYIFAYGGVLSQTNELTDETYINNETIDIGLDEISQKLSEAGGADLTEEINRQLGLL